MMISTRRDFLLSLLTLAAVCSVPEIALADKGSGGGGSSDSGSSGGGSSGDDDDDNGDNSGHGGGGGKGDDKENEGQGKNEELNDLDDDDVRKAVKSGKAMQLRKAMKLARDQNDGRIIDVGLVRNKDKFIYVFTVVAPSGRVETLKMDAVTGRFSDPFGL